MTVIDPADAVAAARVRMGEPDAPAHLAENAAGYLVSFDRDDEAGRVATMSRAWVWVDKTSGDAIPVGSGVVSQLAGSLRPLDL